VCVYVFVFGNFSTKFSSCYGPHMGHVVEADWKAGPGIRTVKEGARLLQAVSKGGVLPRQTQAFSPPARSTAQARILKQRRK